MDKKITSSVVLASFATAQIGISSAHAAEVSSTESGASATVSGILTNTGDADTNLDNPGKEAVNEVGLGTDVSLEKKESVEGNLSETVAESDAQGVDKAGELGENSVLAFGDGSQQGSSTDVEKPTETVDLNSVVPEILESGSFQEKAKAPALTEEELLNRTSTEAEIPGGSNLGSGVSNFQEKERVMDGLGSAVTVGNGGKTSDDGSLKDELKQGEVVNNGKSKEVPGKSDAFASISSSSLDNTASETNSSVFDKLKSNVGGAWISWLGSKKQEKVTKTVKNKDENKKEAEAGKNKYTATVAANKGKKTDNKSGRKRIKKGVRGRKSGLATKGLNSKVKVGRSLKRSKSNSGFLKAITPKSPEAKMLVGSTAVLGAAYGTNKFVDDVFASKSGYPVEPAHNDKPVKDFPEKKDEKPLENTGTEAQKSDSNTGAEPQKNGDGESSKNSSGGFWNTLCEKPFQTLPKSSFVVDKEVGKLVDSCIDLWIRNRIEDIVKGEGKYFNNFSDAVEELGLKKLTVEDLLGKDSEKFVEALSKLSLTDADIDALLLRKDDALGSILEKAGFSGDTVEKLLIDRRKDFLNLLDKSAIKSDVFYRILEEFDQSLSRKSSETSFVRAVIGYLKSRMKGFVPTFGCEYLAKGYSFLRENGVNFGYSIAIIAAAAAISLIQLGFRVYRAVTNARNVWKNDKEKGSFRKFLVTDKEVRSLSYYFGGLFKSIVYPLLMEDQFLELTAKKYNIVGAEVQEVFDLRGTINLWLKRVFVYPVRIVWNLLPPVYFYHWLTDYFPRSIKLLIPGISSGVEDKLEEEGKEEWEKSAFVKGEKERKEEKEKLEKELKEKKQKEEENEPINRFKRLQEGYLKKINDAKEEVINVRKEAVELLGTMSPNDVEEGRKFEFLDLYVRFVALEEYINALRDTSKPWYFLDINTALARQNLVTANFRLDLYAESWFEKMKEKNYKEEDIFKFYKKAEKIRAEKAESLKKSIGADETSEYFQAALKKFFGVDSVEAAIKKINDNENKENQNNIINNDNKNHDNENKENQNNIINHDNKNHDKYDPYNNYDYNKKNRNNKNHNKCDPYNNYDYDYNYDYNKKNRNKFSLFNNYYNYDRDNDIFNNY